MKRHFILLTSLMFVLVMGIQAFAQEDLLYTDIAVGGEAFLEVEPNEARVYLFAESNDRTPHEAHEALRIRIEKITEALVEIGISKEKITTRNFNIYPIRTPYVVQMSGGGYEHGEEEVWYRASYDITVVVDDLSLVSDVIAAGAYASAGLRYITFSVADAYQYRDLLIEKALEDAKEKAGVIARTMGLEIVGIKAINEIGGNYRFAEAIGVQTMEYDMANAMTLGSVPSVPIQPEPQELNMQLYVVFYAKPQ